MKAVMIPIQPYWVFLIIARKMGWNIPLEKTVEVRKSQPNPSVWNRDAFIYCSKNKKSFNRIPAEYQPYMAKLLGKVVGEFMCDEIYTMSYSADYIAEYLFFSHAVKSIKESQDLDAQKLLKDTCLSMQEAIDYMGKKRACCGWHISDLQIYDKPRELSEFERPCICIGEYEGEEYCDCLLCERSGDSDYGTVACDRHFTRSPQSWCYVEV